MLNLHIWGPAFGLPSIDAECTAAAAYCNLILPPGAWILIVAHDASLSPSGLILVGFSLLHHSSLTATPGDLPLLVDGAQRIAGFARISRHLFPLTNASSPTERAGAIALATYLAAGARPLADSLLYTTWSHYSGTTRPAFARVLPSHGALRVPGARHAAATRRSPSDMGATAAPSTQEGQAPSSSASLLFARSRAQQISAHAQSLAARTRLLNRTATLLEPLRAQLARSGGPFLFGERVAPVDCLALGWLGLLVWAPVEDAWGAEAVGQEVRAYVERVRAATCGPLAVDVATVMSSPVIVCDGEENEAVRDAATVRALPWRRAPVASYASVAFGLLYHIEHAVVSPATRDLLQSAEVAVGPAAVGIMALLAGIAAAAYRIASGPGETADKIFHRATPEGWTRLQGLGEAGSLLLSALGEP